MGRGWVGSTKYPSREGGLREEVKASLLILCLVAHTRGVMRRVSDGAIIATCEHGKVDVSGSVREKL